MMGCWIWNLLVTRPFIIQFHNRTLNCPRLGLGAMNMRRPKYGNELSNTYKSVRPATLSSTHSRFRFHRTVLKIGVEVQDIVPKPDPQTAAVLATAGTRMAPAGGIGDGPGNTVFRRFDGKGLKVRVKLPSSPNNDSR